MTRLLIFVILFMGNCCSSKQVDSSCSALPPKLALSRNDSLWSYKPWQASLSLEFAHYLFFSGDWCSLVDYYPYFKVELISTTEQRKASDREKSLRSREAAREKCRQLKKGSFIQSSAILHVNKTSHTFHYVQGMYYMRLWACHDLQHCQENGDDLICSGSLTFAADFAKNKDVCEYDFPSNVSADIMDTTSSSRLIYSSSQINDTENWFCDIALRAVIPLCTAHQSYDTVSVTAVEVAPGN